MRALIVLALLANVGFFAWSQWIARPDGATAGRATGTAPRLVLASEAPQATPLPTLQLEPGVSCLSLGPFTDLTEAARASTSLRGAGLQPRQRAAEGPVWEGWWVSIGGLAGAEDAGRIVERLRQAGMGDAYVMPADAAGTTISLGLFTEQPRALRRADELRALGYVPEVAPRQRDGTVYWIDVDVRSAEQLPDPAGFDGGAGRIFRLQVQPCDLAGQSSRPLAPAAAPGGVPG